MKSDAMLLRLGMQRNAGDRRDFLVLGVMKGHWEGCYTRTLRTAHFWGFAGVFIGHNHVNILDKRRNKLKRKELGVLNVV